MACTHPLSARLVALAIRRGGALRDTCDGCGTPVVVRRESLLIHGLAYPVLARERMNPWRETPELLWRVIRTAYHDIRYRHALAKVWRDLTAMFRRGHD